MCRTTLRTLSVGKLLEGGTKLPVGAEEPSKKLTGGRMWN